MHTDKEYDQQQHDEDVRNEDKNVFGKTFATTLNQHLKRCVVALPLIAMTLYQVSSARPSLRLLTLIAATPYYCLLCFATSVMLSPLLYLHRQTATLQAFLTNVLDKLVSPLKRLKSVDAQALSDSMTKKSQEVLKKEGRGSRKVIVWILVTAVKRVLQMRFGEMIKAEGFTAESFGKIAGRELIGLVLAPVQQSVMAAIGGVSVGAFAFGISPFILLHVLVS